MASRKQKDSTVITGEPESMMGAVGAGLFLKPTNITNGVELQVVLLAAGHQLDTSPPEINPMRVVSSATIRSLTE